MHETQEIPIQLDKKLSVKDKLALDGITVMDSISILAPATLIYDFWRDLTHLPKFFNQLQSVEIISDEVSHWVWKALKDQRTVEWDSRITEDTPGVAISWQTTEDSDVIHAGTVRFVEMPYGRGTMVTVKMVYAPPGGKVTNLVEKLLGESPKQNLSADLKKLRELIETGEIPTTEGQPRGSLH